MNPQRFYAISNRNEEGCMIVVAHTSREAKRLYWRKNDMNIDEFIAVRVNQVKPDHPLPKELPLGILHNSWIGLFYHLYYYIAENCPFCNKCEDFAWDSETESMITCPKCQKEIKETDVIKWELIK